ncbi:MAG: hypothetical protein GAK31_03882 [Stenotrophomonas maltophilia]|uniref:Uncharacterized protein n=1 Tax=Stenotrophomonas maltophilia TaxID=40324 RepID=A0A7V8JK35_STEMA|nr:MAG: hypothetical protein GAK31_03882 [Stenotrophomonas maltophilia]
MKSNLVPNVMAVAEPPIERTAHLRVTLLFVLVLVLNVADCGSPHAPSAFTASPALPEAELKDLYTGTLLKQLSFRDIDGPGLLLLSRSEQTVPAQDDEQPMDQITLRAELFRRTDEARPWSSRWSVEDPVQCKGLDLDAGYFLDQVTATDLDNDGRAELTLASHSSCGGGVDPQQLRIGLRQGEQYYEVRGESLVQVEGDEPFGGERQNDPALASAAAPLRSHLDNVWEAIKRGSSP